MKTIPCSLAAPFSAAAAAALAVLFALPSVSTGFALIGGSLGLSTSGNGYQRDVRCFNNAADAAANDNQTPDPAHPGAIGAALAVWKAAEAWNSDKDGGANFDFDWQGAATSNLSDANTVGWGNANCGGGTLAYTELPLSNGWRVVMCESSWNWSDGPGSVPGGQVDIQGIAAHELGHALGLDHTGIGCSGSCSTRSTMCAFACGSGIDARSLAQDDKNGVAAIYGAIPTNKPLITGISGSTTPGGTLVLSVAGSSLPSSVRVKFTAGTSQNTGTIPGVVLNQTLSGGQVSVVIPAAAQDGNVLVWIPNTSRLSNAFPLDLGSGGPTCNFPTSFGSGEVGSVSGTPAVIGSSGGLPSASNPNFALVLAGANPNAFTWVFWGPVATTQATSWGTLYIGNPSMRAFVGSTTLAGTLTWSVPIVPAMIGMTDHYQFLIRDQQGGGLQNSDALTVTYCP